jgi:succinate dehydrogenase/fumarate reductase-like Fe-S protein
MYAPTTFTEWVRNNRTNIEAALELAVIDWLKTQDVGFDDNFIDLDDNHHGLAGEGENKGKVSYCGSIQTNVKGVPYATCTVSFRRTSEPNRTFKDSYEIVRQMWEDYKAGDDSRTKRAVEYQQAVADERKRREAKAKDEAARKAANVKREIAVFGGLSNDPRGDQDKYLRDKDLVNAIERGAVRYGSDDKGNYTAILLIEADSLSKPARYREPVGVQRFYDRIIEGRKTNKDFTWGMKKSGACYLLGEISKDYVGSLHICEGFADGVVAHYRGHLPVLVGVDKDNLDIVEQTVKEQLPKAQVLTICDNDAHKYKQGVDNGGVLNGVQATIETSGKYVIPDFTGLDQSGKPKDLWDLWHLGGDEAVDKLLSNPQSPPSQDEWETLKLNYLGAKSFLKMLEGKSIDDALELARPHLDRLGLDEKAVVEHVNQAAQKSAKPAQPAVLSIGGGGYTQSAPISRLAKADEIVCIERDYIGVDLLKHRTLLIEGGMGTGKTEWLKNELARLKPLGIKSVLCIYPRRSLAKNSSGRLSLEYYEDIEIISIEADFGSDLQLSAVSNSLKRLGLTGDGRFDVVVMDEIELNIQHIFGGTFDKKGDLRHDTLQILRGLVKNAKHFVGMQAQITQLSYNFLRFCGRDDAYLIRNTYQRFDGHLVAWYQNKEDCISQLYEFLDAREPCIVPSMSQKFLEKLADDLKVRYPNEQIVLVHGGNKGDPHVKAILENPNAARPLALLHSPVIDMGVSIESGWFKHGVGFCQTGDGVGTPESFTQMMFRDRHLKDHAIFVEPQTYNAPVGYSEILDNEIAQFETVARTIKRLDDKNEVIERVQRAVVTPQDKLRAQAQASINASKNNAAAEVHSILDDSMGCDIKFVKPDEADKAKRDEIRADLKAAKERVKADEMAAIVAASPITSKQCEDLCRSNENTSEDIAKIKKHLMEKYLDVRLAFQNPLDLKEIFEFWDNGRGKEKLRLREIMALPQNLVVAYAEKLYVAGKFSLFIIEWLLLTWALEVFGGRFDDGRLEGDGEWVGYKDFQGHTTWEWVKANRDVVNQTGLIYIRGDEPDASEIGGLIKQTGLPIKSKRMDENTEVSNSDDGDVDQKSVQGVPSNTLLYKNNKATPAQENDPRPNKRPRLYTIDLSTVIIPPEATDSLGCLLYDWLIIARLKDLVGLKVLDDGRIECKPGAAFGLADLCQGNEFKEVLANETAFNKAKLGTQIKGGVIDNRGLGVLLSKFGIKKVPARTDKSSKAKTKAEKSKRTQTTYYRLVPSQEPEFLRENLARRADDLYYKKAAQEWLDQKAQEIAEYGAPLIPDRPVSPATALLTIRHRIRRAMYITADGRGGYKCEPDAPYRLEDIVNDLQDFVSRHKDAINCAGLGAKVGDEGLTVKILGLWIKAMGGEYFTKQTYAHKLLIYKNAENASPDNTGDGTRLNGSKGEVCHPNKTAGVENNSNKNNGLQTQKRERIRVCFTKPKCLQKMWVIMDKDEHDREDELIAAIMEDAQKPQNILESKLMEYLDRHRGEYQYVTDLANMLGVKMRDLDPIVAKTKGIECRMDERGKSRIRLPDPFEGTMENPDPDPWGLDDDTLY